jgi:hypothetical protein
LARVDIPLYISGNIGDELGKAQKDWGDLPWDEDLIRWLVLWAWSRKPEQITWTAKAREAIWDLSESLSELYTTSIPILPANEAHIRLARMAVALAARLFATPDGQELRVTAAHVLSAYNLYDRFLSDPGLGLIEVKEREQTVEEASDINSIELRDYLKTSPLQVRQLLAAGELPVVGFGRSDDGGGYIMRLTMLHAIRSNGTQGYIVEKWAMDIAKELGG